MDKLRLLHCFYLFLRALKRIPPQYMHLHSQHHIQKVESIVSHEETREAYIQSWMHACKWRCTCECQSGQYLKLQPAPLFLCIPDILTCCHSICSSSFVRSFLLDLRALTAVVISTVSFTRFFNVCMKLSKAGMHSPRERNMCICSLYRIWSMQGLSECITTGWWWHRACVH